MRRLLPLVSILCLALAGAAAPDGRAALWGTWGSAAQCSRELLLRHGTERAEPVELSQGWLKQGRIWCALGWFPVQPRDNGLFVAARALCGEDAQNAHALALSLTRGASGDELVLIWNDSLISVPMQRCPTAP